MDIKNRTGSVFGVGAYFNKNQIEISGKTTLFTRDTEEGGTFRTHFCPKCGSSVFWNSDKNPDMTGVAVGAFSDPNFTAPVRSVWEQSSHR